MTYKETDDDGIEWWYDRNWRSHRDDGPAIVNPNGDQVWYKHGRSCEQMVELLGTSGIYNAKILQCFGCSRKCPTKNLQY